MKHTNDTEQVDDFVRKRRQEMVESRREIAAALKAYIGPTMLVSGGLLPTMSPVIDCGNNIVTASNLMVDKVYNSINDSNLQNIFDLDDLNNDKFSIKDFEKVAKIMDLGYKYADADKYYNTDVTDESRSFKSLDGSKTFKAQSIAVYGKNLNEVQFGVIRTSDDEFYIRKVTSDDYDNMRECTYDEYNPWHKDVSQSLQENGEDYSNIKDLKEISIDRIDEGGEPGKDNRELVEVGDTDSYDKNKSVGSTAREKYEKRIRAQVDSIESKQDTMSYDKKDDEIMNRMFYGKRAVKYM